MEILLEHTGKGFITMLTIAMPAVLTAASIGLVVGILQAVTQVQEQTIAAAPKILGVFIVIIAMGPFSSTTLTEYFKTSANIAFDVIPRDEATVLSNEELYEYNQKHNEEGYYKKNSPDIEDIMKNPGDVPYYKDKDKKSVQSPQKSISQPNFIEQQKIQSGN